MRIDPRTLKPEHDPQTLETNVPGLFVAGAVAAGRETSRIFIENGRFHGEAIVGSLLARTGRGQGLSPPFGVGRWPQSTDSTMGRIQMFRKRTGWLWSWRPRGSLAAWAL